MSKKHTGYWAVLLTASFLLISTAEGHSGPNSWGPWSADDPPKVTGKKKKSLYDGNILKMALTSGVRFFQKFISPVDGDKCSMYPTCSHYSIQALKKHGALIGFIMTADRLLHEVDEQQFAPVILKYKQYRFLDPVDNNDFWWYSKKEGK